MTLSQALTQATERLKGTCERPRFEAEVLLARFVGVDRARLIVRGDEVLGDAEGFMAWVARRAESEPSEYITGRVSFYDIELSIAPGALIPRPETEILVDKAAEVIRREGYTRIAEIGVGSGAVSVVLARMFPDLRIVATDISPEALAIARRNVEAFGLEDRIDLRQTSLLDGVEEPVEMIVSNPPYVDPAEELSPNVHAYEPHTALYADEEGMALLRQIIALAHERGVGHLACEMGYDQREAVSAAVKEFGVYSPEALRFYRDLAGHDRGFVIEIRS
jgi:release factor glutamine methyltransferase